MGVDERANFWCVEAEKDPSSYSVRRNEDTGIWAEAGPRYGGHRTLRDDLAEGPLEVHTNLQFCTPRIGGGYDPTYLRGVHFRGPPLRKAQRHVDEVTATLQQESEAWAAEADDQDDVIEDDDDVIEDDDVEDEDEDDDVEDEGGAM